MRFNDILHRANLNVIETYLLHGDDDNEKPTDKTYCQRLDETRKKTTAFLRSKYPDIEEFDEIIGHISEQACVYGDVYFEIGLIVGAKIAFQIGERLGEIK